MTDAQRAIKYKTGGFLQRTATIPKCNALSVKTQAIGFEEVFHFPCRFCIA